MPVLLSGGILVQSTLTVVNMDVGSLGLTSIASEFVPDTIRFEMLKVNFVYAPVTVDDVATWLPFTQTLAEPMTPFTISVGVGPDLAHEAVTELHVVGEEHAVRAAGALVYRLQGGVTGAEAVLGERLDLGAGSVGVVVADRQPAGGVEARRGDLSARLGGRGAALHLPAAAAQVRDVAGPG